MQKRDLQWMIRVATVKQLRTHTETDTNINIIIDISTAHRRIFSFLSY